MTEIVRRYHLAEIGLVSLAIVGLHYLVLGMTASLTPAVVAGPALVAAGIALLWRRMDMGVVLLLLSSVLYLADEEGLGLPELIYFSYTLLIVALTFGSDLLRGSLKAPTTLDKLALLIIVLIPYAVVLGLFNGGGKTAIGEATTYFGFLGYFAYRKFMDRPEFRKFLFAAMVLILAYVAIRNIFNYREIILAAQMSWQAQNARASSNEVLLLAGAFSSMVWVVQSRKLAYKILGVGAFSIFLFDIIITQSRGYWLAFAFGAFMIWWAGNRKIKIQIASIAAAMILVGLSVGYLFFNDVFNVVLEGLGRRLSTLGSGELDISLKQRVEESITVFERMVVNPITGYGFGVKFPRVSYIDQIYIHYSYVHNGYLAAWYKFGLFGLVAMISLALIIARRAYQIYQGNQAQVVKVIALSIVGLISGMLLVNITSPQFFSFDSMLLFALMGVFAAYYSPDDSRPGA